MEYCFDCNRNFPNTLALMCDLVHFLVTSEEMVLNIDVGRT